MKNSKSLSTLTAELSKLEQRFYYWFSRDRNHKNTNYWIDHLAWEIGLKKQEIEVVKNEKI